MYREVRVSLQIHACMQKMKSHKSSHAINVHTVDVHSENRVVPLVRPRCGTVELGDGAWRCRARILKQVDFSVGDQVSCMIKWMTARIEAYMYTVKIQNKRVCASFSSQKRMCTCQSTEAMAVHHLIAMQLRGRIQIGVRMVTLCSLQSA